MLRLIADLCAAALLVVVLVAFIRARRSRHRHHISVAEIHPDLAAGEELVRDVLDERQRLESDVRASQEDDRGASNPTPTRAVAPTERG